MKTYHAHSKLCYRKGEDKAGEIPIALADYICSNSRYRYIGVSVRCSGKQAGELTGPYQVCKQLERIIYRSHRVTARSRIQDWCYVFG